MKKAENTNSAEEIQIKMAALDENGKLMLIRYWRHGAMYFIVTKNSGKVRVTNKMAERILAEGRATIVTSA